MSISKENSNKKTKVTYSCSKSDDEKEWVLISNGEGSFYYNIKKNYVIESDSCTEKLPPQDQLLKKSGKNINGESILENRAACMLENDNKLQIVDAVIQLAYDCNLACTYCYAEQGTYGISKNLMNEETAKKTVDFVLVNRYGNKVGFCLLGGEPLINKSVMKVLIDYALQQGVRLGVEVEFLITTNGIGLTKNLLSWLKKRNVAIRLSIDGTKEIHDHFRKTHTGEGTYDTVVKKYGELLKASGISYQVRCTYFGDYSDAMVDQAENLLVHEAFKNIKMDFIWGDKDIPGAINSTNLPKVLKNIDALSCWYENKLAEGRLSFTSLHPFSKWFEKIKNQRKVYNILPKGLTLTDYQGSVLEANGVECGAAVNVVSISTKGDIYSCHRMEGREEHLIGNVFRGVNLLKTQYWHNNWRLTHPLSDCGKCWVRYICNGGCPSFGVDEHQDPMRNDRDKCAIRRQFIANSILIAKKYNKITILKIT